MKSALSLAATALAFGFVPAALAESDVVTVRAYFDPGFNYFRAAQDSLAQAGVKLELKAVEGDWLKDEPLHLRGATAKAVVAGAVVTTATRHLTAAERAAGLEEVTLGSFAGIVMAHPAAPIESIDLKKWTAVLARKKLGALKWSELGTVAAGKDGPVSWALPDTMFKAWAAPLVKLRVLSEAIIASMPKKTAIEPEDVSIRVSQDKTAIAPFGYNFVTENLAHPLSPVKILKVDGVAPTNATVADGTYPLAMPLVAVYAAKAATPQSALGKLVTWLKSERSARVATMRALVPAAPAKG